MPFQLPALPNFNVETPDMAQTALKWGALKNMQSEQALRQQLAPLNVQEAQQRLRQTTAAATSAETTNELQRIALNDSRIMSDYLKTGDAGEETPSDFSMRDKIAAYTQVDKTDPIMGFLAGLAKKGYSGQGLLAQAQSMIQKRTEYNKGTEELQTIQKNERLVWQEALAELHELPADQRSVALSLKLPLLQENSKSDPLLEQYAGALNGHPELIDMAYNTLSAENASLGLRKAKAEAKKTEQEADLILKLSTPEALAAPGAVAAIQAKIADPKTQPEDVPRLQLLLPKAEIAQNQVVNMKRRELLAQQAVTQGGAEGANALAEMLVKRQITVDEMKVRGLTPQFEAQVFGLAVRKDPTWKAPEAAAQSHIAASAANQQFFGNTDSLLVQGGTLDQLSAAGKALGLTQIPAFNTLENWRQAALGKGPQAAYAAAALGVADDYSKVMTGSGQGSDTSRLQALQIISKNLSPEGREAAIGQIRQQVQSQREGRIGSNPYLRDMYPHPNQAATGRANVEHKPGGAATGLTEGQTGTGSDKKKYIVKGGVWVEQ